MDPTMMMMGAGFMSMLSMASSFGAYYYKDTLCAKYPTIPLLCGQAPTDPPVTTSEDTTPPTTDAPTTAPGAGTLGNTGNNSSGNTLNRRFSPYVLLNNNAVPLVGTKSKWTTLAFVIGYANNKIQWDAGTVTESKLKERIAAARKSGGGVIVSFGGQGAGATGTKYRSELAGKYTDPQKLANAYEAIAKALSSTWLDFDIEGSALKDTAAIDRRNKALYLLQKKRKDIRVSFTVPVGLGGLNTDTKNMLNKAKTAGVRIDLVNLMTMYFTSKKQTMSTAVTTATNAAKAFVKTLGAKIGVTPQIGKNPDKPYTHEQFTTGDATRVVAWAKKDTDVSLVSFWSLNNDNSKYKGAYSKIFKGFP